MEKKDTFQSPGRRSPEGFDRRKANRLEKSQNSASDFDHSDSLATRNESLVVLSESISKVLRDRDSENSTFNVLGRSLVGLETA